MHNQMEKAVECKASSSNDAGLWRKLLEKARKGTTTEPYFVVDIVEGCLHTSMFCKLGLPAVFLSHYQKNLTENIILEGPDGHKWPVMLGLSWESKPCLLNGWREFTADFNLAVNDKVLFFLWEDSHFLVQAFDNHHNIKRRDGGTDHGDRTKTLHLEGGIKMGPKKVAHQSNNTTEVHKKVDTEDHASQAAPSRAPSRQELGKPGDAEDPNEETMAKQLGSLPGSANALSSDAEEEQVSSLKRSRKLNRETEDREGDELYTLSTDRLGISIKSVNEKTALHESITAEEQSPIENSVTKANKGAKLVKYGGKEMKQQKRSQKLPTEGAKVGSASRKRPAKGMKRTPVDAQDALPRPEEFLTGNSKDEVQLCREKGKEPAAEKGMEAASPLTPLSAKEVKPAFKRPKPRILPNPSPKLLYISKRRPVSTQERDAALLSAQDYGRSSINKNFVMQMRTSQVYCGFHLAVPPQFVVAMELPLERKKLTLFDVTGKTWDVEWLGDHPKRPGLHSAGWTKFALEHCLEEGDACVFELPDPNMFNISVQIFPVVPLAPNPDHGWRSHYIVPDDVAQPAPFSPKPETPPLLPTSAAPPTLWDNAGVPTIAQLIASGKPKNC